MLAMRINHHYDTVMEEPRYSLNDQSWREDARCRTVFDPEIFFPETKEQRRLAIAYCGECAVKAACLNYAIEHNEKAGVWGGVEMKPRRARVAIAKPITEGNRGPWLDELQQDALRETLSERDREIVALRYGFNESTLMTLNEIGRQYQLSGERVRTIINRALLKMRNVPVLSELLEP